jgi:hypothetical protein
VVDVTGQEVIGTALDYAGNSVSSTAYVSLDTTPPTIEAAADRAANSHGWYDEDVIVSFTCNDDRSGVQTCPAPQNLGEGAMQSASGTAIDAAGNTASDEVSGINIDKTAPTLNGAATTAPNANGWYNTDVTIQWSCGDDLSGLDGECPADSLVTGEGDNLSANASVADKAGHMTNATVTAIKIDRSAPTTLASLPPALPSGWYAGPVEVTLMAEDALSGVGTIFYKVGDGDAQIYTSPFFHSLEGEHTITFWSVDNAGNEEDSSALLQSIEIKIDTTKPSIQATPDPLANANGWNNDDVTVSFDCADNDGGSGLASCSDPVVLSNEGIDQTATGFAVDNAGNSASAMVSNIQIDKSVPTIAASVDRPANDAGWYNDDVLVTFTCEDSLSGIASCQEPEVLVEGKNQSATGTATDHAGNSAVASIENINIDSTPPSISLNLEGQYLLNSQPPIPTCIATDELSGFADEVGVARVAQSPSLYLPVLLGGNHAEGDSMHSGPQAESTYIVSSAGFTSSICEISSLTTDTIGVKTVTAKTTDLAGNEGTTTASYSVVYPFNGFLQPVDNLPVINQVKAGSAIPIKFSLGGDRGLNILAAGYPKSQVVACSTSDTTSEIEETITAGESSLKYDAASGQYNYVWKTQKSWSGCRQLIVKLVDGTEHRATFQFKK